MQIWFLGFSDVCSYLFAHFFQQLFLLFGCGSSLLDSLLIPTSSFEISSFGFKCLCCCCCFACFFLLEFHHGLILVANGSTQSVVPFSFMSCPTCSTIEPPSSFACVLLLPPLLFYFFHFSACAAAFFVSAVFLCFDSILCLRLQLFLYFSMIPWYLFGAQASHPQCFFQFDPFCRVLLCRACTAPMWIMSLFFETETVKRKIKSQSRLRNRYLGSDSHKSANSGASPPVVHHVT